MNREATKATRNELDVASPASPSPEDSPSPLGTTTTGLVHAAVASTHCVVPVVTLVPVLINPT